MVVAEVLDVEVEDPAIEGNGCGLPLLLSDFEHNHLGLFHLKGSYSM